MDTTIFQKIMLFIMSHDGIYNTLQNIQWNDFRSRENNWQNFFWNYHGIFFKEIYTNNILSLIIYF